MKKLFLTATVLCSVVSHAAYAERGGFDFTDTAKVVSARPVYEQVGQPHRECWDEEVSERDQPRGRRERGLGGTIIGGLAGGLLGSQVGGGNGKTAAAAVGAVTGAVVGDHLENDDDRGYASSRTRSVQRCKDVTDSHEEVVGYDVKYRFNGRTFTTRMKQDPGNTVRVGITVLDR
jgi:uncharacterized protein YcfJ